MIQRLIDYLRERRIAKLQRAMCATNDQRAWAAMLRMFDEIDRRSPQQLARMAREAK